MANMKNIDNYKGNLELCTSNLMELINNMPQQEMEGMDLLNVQKINPCLIWEWIKGELVGGCHGNREGILEFLCDILKEILCDKIVENCALRKELVRALKLCECLAQAIRQVNCNNRLEDLVGRLFCLLVRAILEVVSIIAKIIILLIFCRDNNCGYNNREVLPYFCKCLICDLEKELDQLEDLIGDLNKLAIMFITDGAEQCKCKEHHNYNNMLYYDDEQEYIGYGNKPNYNRPCNCKNNHNENQCKKNKPCK